MLYFHKYNEELQKNKFQENIANKCDTVFGYLQQFYHCCKHGTYSQHVMSDSPISILAIFYLNKNKKIFSNIYVISYVPLLQLR